MAGQHEDIDHTGLVGVGGSVATDAIFDAKGDLAVGTGANTAAKLTVGANDTIPMADSGQATGIKWVASQTPSTQAFSDAAAEGTADTYARGDHKHAMPANPGGGGVVPWSIAPTGGIVHRGFQPVGAANRAVYMPATIPAACTITGIRMRVGTQSGNICVGLYDDTGARVATSGAVACPASGLANVNFTGNYSAAAGRYYLAISVDNNTATFSVDTDGTTASPATGKFEASAHPLPATATMSEPIYGLNIMGRVNGGYP